MEEVYLWLGANVMLAYPLDEAETMLAEKLSAAESSLAHCEEDLEFLREQITVCLENEYIDYRILSSISNLSFLLVDSGGCHGARLQLGCGATAEREGRGDGRYQIERWPN